MQAARRRFIKGLAFAPSLLLPERLARATAMQQMLLLGGGDPTTDPNFSSVVLLHHFDSGGPVFTDFSSKGHNSSTMQGNATASATQSKFGGASGFFRGDSFKDCVQYSPGTDFAFGTGAFTVEFWAYYGTVGSVFSTLNVPQDSTGCVFYLSGTSSPFIIARNNDAVSAGIHAFGGSTVSAGTWNHFAICRDGSQNWYGFINGVSQTDSPTNPTTLNNLTKSSVGAVGSWTYSGSTTTDYLNGYIDDLRVTKGVCRYTANFTPRVTAFPNS